MTILGDIGTHRLQRGAVWDAVCFEVYPETFLAILQGFPFDYVVTWMQKFWVADTPPKFNIDTKNSNFLKGDTSSKPSFFCIYVRFQGCNSTPTIGFFCVILARCKKWWCEGWYHFSDGSEILPDILCSRSRCFCLFFGSISSIWSLKGMEWHTVLVQVSMMPVVWASNCLIDYELSL